MDPATKLGEVSLNQAEKDEIATLCINLMVRYPTLKICGIPFLERMQISPRIEGSSLYLAAQHGYVDVIRTFLADPHVDPNQAMIDGATPLYTAALSGHLDVVQALLPYQAATNNNDSLILAARSGYFTFVRTLLSYEASRDYYLNQLILKQALMQDAFTQNPIFFRELARHSHELWTRLQNPTRFNLSLDAHRVLLETILESAQEQDNALRHPLYTLFETTTPFFYFFTCPNTVLNKVRAFLNERPIHIHRL